MPKDDLIRQMGLFDSTMMLVGIVIGSGIFLTTGIMAQSLPSSGLILLAWIFGGLIVLCGALTYAELGAAMPEAGGQYVYLKEAYSPLYGFLFGWQLFLVSMSGAIAALALQNLGLPFHSPGIYHCVNGHFDQRLDRKTSGIPGRIRPGSNRYTDLLCMEKTVSQWVSRPVNRPQMTARCRDAIYRVRKIAGGNKKRRQ